LAGVLQRSAEEVISPFGNDLVSVSIRLLCEELLLRCSD